MYNKFKSKFIRHTCTLINYYVHTYKNITLYTAKQNVKKETPWHSGWKFTGTTDSYVF